MQWQKPLKCVTKVTESYSLIHFDSVDINGNLKIRFNDPIKRRLILNINNKMELTRMICLIEHFEYHTKFGELNNQSDFEEK